MAKNLGNKVSKVLESKDRNFSSVVFQQKRPPLDSEWNLVQDIISSKNNELLKKMVPSGFLDIGDITTAPSDRSLLTSNWKNVLKFKNTSAIVNGWIVDIGGGTNQFQSNAQKNIWEDLSGDADEIAFITKDGPQSGYRQDLIFLEVFQKLIGPESTIYKNGFTQSAQEYIDNDLIDSNIEIETSRRVQIQYNIRYVTGVDFISYRDGLGFSGCYGKAGATIENSNYVYAKHATDSGLYVTGDGSAKSQADLGTVDGYAYAIPLFRIHKRNRTAWSLTNQNGSKYSMTSGSNSDRPDGLFYDEINVKDVEDLRHQISFGGFDYETLLEENLNLLWTKNTPTELKHSTLDENVAGNKVSYIDGIATTPVLGIDISGRVPNGSRRVFSEGRENQKISFFISNPSISGNQITFSPIGHNTGVEYSLFDETTFYMSSKVPEVYTYNTTTKVITSVVGGTWQGLGEMRTWSYTSGNRNKVIYTPQNITDIQNKLVIFCFTLVHREGGGLDKQSKGFTNNISKMLQAKSINDSRPIDFNLYSDEYRNVTLVSPRKVGTYTDSAISRSISSFESATTALTGNTAKYKAATLELKYHIQSDGSVDLTIPTELYSRTVLGVLQVFNITRQIYISPAQTKITAGLKLTNLVVSSGDILEITVLLGNYLIDYVPQIKGIRNIVKPFVLPSAAIGLGETTGIINAKQIYSTCDGVLSTTGFFNGTSYRHVAFINNTMVYLSKIEGLGTPLIKFTLDPNEYPNGATLAGSLTIYGLGYYNPVSTDSFYFQYEYTPYAGLITSRLEFGETQQVKVLKVDDKVTVTTAGTGSSEQYLPSEYKGLTEALPINKVCYDFTLFGENIATPITGGNSSLRRIPGRWLATETAGVEPLSEGQIIDITIGVTDKVMLRGAVISSPKIIERGIDLATPKNHLTQWSAIVLGMGSYAGELFLMVITTVSTIYNSSEGSNYEFLTENGTYSSEALGKGSETILDNTLSGVDLSQNLGNKILGAVDIFPLKNRPIILPKNS